MLTTAVCPNAASSTAMGVIPVPGGNRGRGVLKRVQLTNADGTARTVTLSTVPQGDASLTAVTLLTLAVAATTGKVDLDLGVGLTFRTPITVTASGAITNAGDLVLYAYVDSVSGGKPA